MPMRPRSGSACVVRHRKSCSSSSRARVLETEHLAALRIDARHHMFYGAILAGRIHGLEDQQYRVAIGSVLQLLQLAQFGNVFRQHFLILFF